MLAAVLKIHNKVNPDEGKNTTPTQNINSSETYNRSEKAESIRPSQKVEALEGIEEQEDHKDDEAPCESHYQPKLFDVWAMVITTVIGGSMYGWSAALEIGFGGFLIAQLLVGMAFVILVYSLAEIVSTKSFTGGSYGMGRVVLGFYPGFLIACFELIEYLSYSAASTQFISSFIITKFGWDSEYEPLVALCFYVCCLTLLLERNYCYWRFIYLIALFSIVVVFMYCFGSLPYTNFSENASMHIDEVGIDNSGSTVGSNDDSLTPLTRNWFRGGIVMFLQILPYTTWGFAGVESGALVTDLVVNPQKNIPGGLIAGVWSLFGLLIFTIFVCCSLPPGLSTVFQEDDDASVTKELFMDTGFSLMGMSADTAEWLLLPAQIGMAFGFMLPAAKLYHAMAESKLFPFFPWTCPSRIRDEEVESEQKSMKSAYTVTHEINTSNDVVDIFAITLPASYAIYLLAMFYPEFDITNTPILLATIVYISDLYAFYKLQTVYNNLERDRKSPFGLIGAFYATMVFLLCIIGMIGFMEDYQLVIMLSCVFVLLSCYYFFYAQSKQILSKSEQKSVFVLHVINFNRSKRRRMAKKRSLSANKRSFSGAGGASSAFNSHPDFR